jgi:hypothetical protein
MWPHWSSGVLFAFFGKTHTTPCVCEVYSVAGCWCSASWERKDFSSKDSIRMLWSFFRCPFIQMCWTQCLLFVQNLKGLCLYCPMLWKAIWALGAAARHIWIKSVAQPECSSILTMPKKLFAASFLLLYQSWNLYFLFSNMESSLGKQVKLYGMSVVWLESSMGSLLGLGRSH